MLEELPGGFAKDLDKMLISQFLIVSFIFSSCLFYLRCAGSLLLLGTKTASSCEFKFDCILPACVASSCRERAAAAHYDSKKNVASSA